jgi:putative effector of murein hydrolase
MKSINEIRANAEDNRHLYIYISVGLFFGLLFFGSFNWVIFLITVILFFVGFILNEYLNKENLGLVAVMQMVLIIAIIGFGDYYSSNGNRIENLANFLAPLFFALSAYGFYLSRKD